MYNRSCKPPDRRSVGLTDRNLMPTDATRASTQCVVVEAGLNQGEYSSQTRAAAFQPPVSHWLKSGLVPSGG